MVMNACLIATAMTVGVLRHPDLGKLYYPPTYEYALLYEYRGAKNKTNWEFMDSLVRYRAETPQNLCKRLKVPSESVQVLLPTPPKGTLPAKIDEKTMLNLLDVAGWDCPGVQHNSGYFAFWLRRKQQRGHFKSKEELEKAKVTVRTKEATPGKPRTEEFMWDDKKSSAQVIKPSASQLFNALAGTDRPRSYLHDVFNLLGAKGWCMFDVSQISPNEVEYYFERPKTPPEPGALDRFLISIGAKRLVDSETGQPIKK